VETIEVELAMADLVTVEKRLESVRGKAKAGLTKEIERQIALLSNMKEALGAGRLASTVSRAEEDAPFMHELQLLTDKPVLYIVNVDESAAAHKGWQSSLGDSRTALPLSVKVESEIVDLPANEQQEFLEALGLTQTGLDRLITKCYEMLGLMTYFTSGEKESRAWTVTQGTKAPQAAGVIHTDFEKTFIRAEIINWKDFVELGENGAREAGKLRIEGKEYVMRDGDVAHFRVGA
jgi:GTP-binding protein YchF